MKADVTTPLVAAAEGFGLACDRLTDTLQDAADAIYAAKMSARGSVMLDERWALVYGKWHERWGLHLEDTQNDNQPKDLYSAPVLIRMMAARAIPQLVDVLRETRADRTTEVTSVASELSSYIRKLNQTTSEASEHRGPPSR